MNKHNQKAAFHEYLRQMMFVPPYQTLTPVTYSYNGIDSPLFKTQPYCFYPRQLTKPFVNVLHSIHITTPYLMNCNYYMCNCMSAEQHSCCSKENIPNETTARNEPVQVEDDHTNTKSEVKNKTNEENENPSQSISSVSISVFLGKKKRIRKNNSQLQALNNFYKGNKRWTKSSILQISQETGLKENKVYKWLWDQKNKDLKNAKFYVNK